MKKSDFERAIDIASKEINTMIAGADKKLDNDELTAAVKAAEVNLNKIFPKNSRRFYLSPIAHDGDDFAGFRIAGGGFVDSREFDFGSVGIDVDTGGNKSDEEE